MRKLSVFNQVSLDGYFIDSNGDMSWAHADRKDAEFNAFVADNASNGGELVFGRITYQMMASYWPTPLAAQNDPVVADRMNNLPKVVFSRTLDKVTWQNTKLVKEGIGAAILKMKQTPGPDLAILGSGSVVAQLAEEGLIDEYQIVVNPLVLGGGRTMFDGVTKQLSFKLTKSRTFKHGKVLLCYAPNR